MVSTNNIPSFTLGQLVLLFKPAVKQHTSRKLTARWTGPFKVVQVLDNRVNYYIQKCSHQGELSARNKPYLVHVSRIKQYIVHMADSIRAK